MLPTERFSSRVENYVKYRPGYPATAIGMLKSEVGLMPDWVIGDIGAGPGNLTRLFLENGNRVYAVEPNKEMREAGVKLLGSNQNFISINGTAESTTLASGTVDLVTIGQAFHWFDRKATKEEVIRILKPNGWAAIFYNNRIFGRSGLQERYDVIIDRYSKDFAYVRSTNVPENDLKAFFEPDEMRSWKTEHAQHLNREAYLGRVLSSSYVPQNDSNCFDEMVKELNRLFDQYSADGVITFEYETEVMFGRPGHAG